MDFRECCPSPPEVSGQQHSHTSVCVYMCRCKRLERDANEFLLLRQITVWPSSMLRYRAFIGAHSVLSVCPALGSNSICVLLVIIAIPFAFHSIRCRLSKLINRLSKETRSKVALGLPISIASVKCTQMNSTISKAAI